MLSSTTTLFLFFSLLPPCFPQPQLPLHPPARREVPQSATAPPAPSYATSTPPPLPPHTCYWPANSDTLFVVDSTPWVGGEENHRLLLRLVSRLAGHILARQSNSIALVQMTPELRFEFDFLDAHEVERLRYQGNSALEQMIMAAPYAPCVSLRREYCTRRATSLNAIVEWLLKEEESNNRPRSVDIIVLITTAAYMPRAINTGEVLVAGRAKHTPIHLFIVTVGGDGGQLLQANYPTSAATAIVAGQHYHFAATTAHLILRDLAHLSDVVTPLCESVRSFLGDATTGGAYQDASNSEYASAGLAGFFSGSLCLMCISLITAIAVAVVSMLCYAAYRHHQESERLRSQLASERGQLQQQDGYYKAKLAEREEMDKEREKVFVDMINESSRLRNAYRDEQAVLRRNMTVPVAWWRRGQGATAQRQPPRPVVGGDPSAPMAAGPSNSATTTNDAAASSDRWTDKTTDLRRMRGGMAPVDTVDLVTAGGVGPERSSPSLVGFREQPTIVVDGVGEEEEEAAADDPSQGQPHHRPRSRLASAGGGGLAHGMFQSSTGTRRPHQSRSAGPQLRRGTTPTTMSAHQQPTGASSKPQRGAGGERHKGATTTPLSFKERQRVGHHKASSASRSSRSGKQEKRDDIDASIAREEEPKRVVTDDSMLENVVVDGVDEENTSTTSLAADLEGLLEEFPPDDPQNDDLHSSYTHLQAGHPALHLPPVDLLLLVDASSSIGIHNFQEIKTLLCNFTEDIDISPGRSRVAVILFANEPQVYFDFNRFYSNKAVKAAISRMPYLGGATFLAKALSFSAGVLWKEQNMREHHGAHHHHHHHLRFLPTPRHDRLQAMVVVSDGGSDDSDHVVEQATRIHERLQVKMAGVVTKSFNRDRLRAITRHEGTVFSAVASVGEREALSIWLWNAQKMWNENFGAYVERERTFAS